MVLVVWVYYLSYLTADPLCTLIFQQGVPQKDITENPEIYTHVSFVPRIVIGGQLTTSEFLKPGRSRKALSRVVGYGPEVKRLWRNLDLPPSNINRDGNIEVTRNCDRGIKRCGG